MRIDSPRMSNAIVTGSFSGSFTGEFIGDIQADSVDYANVLNKPTLVSGSEQISIVETTGYSDFSSSFASDIASNSSQISDLQSFSSSLGEGFATDQELSNVSGALATSIGDVSTELTSVSGALESHINSVEGSLSSYVPTNSAQALGSGTNVLTLSSNTLTLTRGDGSTDTIDLSAFLDEDSRAISSGVLDGPTGIVTFTRDDSTTFTLDLSDLLDDTNLVTSVAGKTGVVTLNTGDVSESSNLYYTDARVKTKLNAENVISSSAQITITESQISDLVHYTDADVKTKLNTEAVVSGSATQVRSFLNVENGADVTDTANVTAAGALMDSELTSLSGVKTLTVPDNTTISAFGKTLVDDADAAAARTTLGVDAAGTDNSTDVTLAGTYDYITISGQIITRNQVDASTDISNLTSTNVTEGTRLYYTDARVKTKLNAESVISSSAQVTVTESQISDLQSYVTTTSAQALGSAANVLTLSSNTLTLSRGDGSTDTVDLSAYLDEDSRAISSGVLDGATGIVTFTRDDASTFTLDLSDLLDDTNLVTSVAGRTGVITLTSSDVSEGTRLYYTDARVKTKLNAEAVVSGSATEVRSFLNVENGATADQTAGEIKTAYESNADTNAFTDALLSKLNAIEALADVTDTANVTAAGALMDSEVDADIKTLSLPANTTISTFGASLVDDADASAARTTLGVDTKANTYTGISGDVTITSLGVATVADDSHNHIISNVDGLQTALDGKSDTSHNHTLDSLSNTTITSNSSGEILKWNGSAWINNTLAEAGIAAASHTHSLAEITDVTATAAEVNVLDGITATTVELNYTDGVTSNIQTQLNGKSSTSHNHTLDSLSNTTITSNSSGEILKWNGSAWVNNTLAEAGIAAASHTHAISDVTGLQSALDLKAPLASPTFTGTVIAPTPADNDNSTKVATTAFVMREISDLIGNAGTALDTLGEISASLSADSGALDSLVTVVSGKLAKASNLSDLTSPSDARTNLELGALATLSSVDAATITDNSVGAAELNVSGNGTTAQYLRSDGDGSFTWATPTNTTYSVATDTVLGLIELFSNTDQTVAANAVTTTAGRTYGLQLNAANQGVVNVPWTDTTYSVGDGGLTEKNFTTALKTKLDGIEASANNYSLPAATSTVRGGIELFSDTAQTVAANAVTTTASRTYGIQVNADGQAVVNVPWVDTNTTYTRASFINQDVNTTDNVHFEGLMVGQTTGATANTIRCIGDVVAYYSSDAQFKDNVQTLEGALDKVKAIRGVRFDWNDKQDVYEGHDIGVIAQEVEVVLPELVHYREHSDSKAVDYVKLTAVLIEAVKELSAKVEKLENKL